MTEGTCPECGDLLVQPKRGRRKTYCSDRCSRAQVARRKSAAVQAARRCYNCGAAAVNKTSRPICFDCRAATQARRSRGRTLRPHGVTVDQYDDMLAAQDGRCAICRTEEPGRGHPSFCVDHDHATGKVRGLLCYSCNIGLGHFQDDSERMRAAISYLAAR